ncbi:cation:proton antiporter [Agaribacterium haliotis]|uniref:cation:proton antiporter n=1 Tax=Agaribacterium haliotis TaxID=2013869 RepID=UPI000BB539EA|nr:cation:proton antiporter [Agaribacterium haliotis]
MHVDAGVLLILTVVVALFVGVLTRHVLKQSHLPYTVALLIIGLLVGLVERFFYSSGPSSPFQQSVDFLTQLDPHLILFVFLPILIFESAFSIEVHLFRRLFSQLLVLAVPVFIVATIATAAFAFYFLPVEWSWPVALLFGALISATDPVAVVALLKEVCPRKRLETLIEGEALLNDGTAIVLFSLFVTLLAADAGSSSLLSVSGSFIWVVCLGFVSGLAIGGLALMWIGRVFNDPLLEICISIGTAYLVYFVAEYVLHASGIVALVTAALLFAGIGRTQISSEVAEFMHKFWELMAYVANTLIFLLVGVLISKRIDLGSPQLWFALFALYIALLIIRAASIGLFLPVLKRIGIGINRDKTLVLIWGGLRGAVALALALSLVQSKLLEPHIADQILFLCAGVVVLTLLINATSMVWLLRKLGLDKLPLAKQVTLNKARQQQQFELNTFIPQLQQEEFLTNADWANIYKDYCGEAPDENAEIPSLHTEDKQVVSASEDEILIAYERRLLEAERKNYWIQYHEGLLDRESTQHLIESIELALDGRPKLHPREKLDEYWQLPLFSRLSRKFKLLDKFVLALYYRRMSLGYEITCGFLRAQLEVQNYVDKLAPNAAAVKLVNEKIQRNINDAHKRTALLRDTFPELIGELESSSARCLVLRRKRAIVQRQLDHAVLDKAEAQKMIDDIEAELAKNRSKHAHFSLAPASELLRQQAFFQELSNELQNKLTRLAKHRVFSAGDSILHFADHSGSLVLILRGNAEILTPRGEKQQLLKPGSWIGAEAIIDGELSYSLVACSPVDCLSLPGSALKQLDEKHYNELKRQLKKLRLP